MDVFTTIIPSATGSTAGKAFWRRRSAGSLPQTLEMTPPTGFNFTDTYGNWCQYGGRLYGAGIGTDNAMVDENFRFMRQGIMPPIQVPTLTAAAGPGTSGACVVCIAFYDVFTDEWSPLSGESNEVTLSNHKRTVGNIQTTAEERVTHVGIWVSMDGAAFRLSTMRQIGISTVTEGVATLALGAAFPTTFKRMPRVSMNAIYHERLIAAGAFGKEDIVYVSAIGRPERYEGLSFKTKNGEHVTAIIPVHNDVCLIMTSRNAYALRGYRDADMTMTLLDPNVGCLNNRCWDYAHGRPIVVNQQGFWLYNGAFHNISRDRATEWTSYYKTNRALVERSFAVVDENDYTFSLIMSGAQDTPTEIPNPDSIAFLTIMWVADYRKCAPEISGQMGQPDWYIDIMARQVDSAGRLTLPGTRRTDVYFGSCDGYVRGKDDTDNNDDGDTYGKRMWIRTKANDMGDPGGGPDDGKMLAEMWSYVKSDSAWTLYVHGGDEEAWRIHTDLGTQLLPDNLVRFWRDNVSASADELGADTYVYPGKSVHYHKPQRVSGRCITFDYTFPTPLNVRFRGLGGVYGPGRTTRGPIGVEMPK